MSKITVREIKRKHRKMLTKLFEQFIDKFGSDKLANIIDSTFESKGEKTEEDKQSENKKMILFAVNILKQIFEFLDEDVKPLLSSLTDIPLDDFDEKAPFDIEVQVIQQLMDREEFLNFFIGASQAFKKMQRLGNG